MSARRHVPRDCPSCHARRAVVVPSPWWGVALVLGWGLFAAMVFGLGLFGIAGIGVLPFPALYALGVLPPLHERAAALPGCRACGRVVVPRAGATPQLREPEGSSMVHQHV